MSNVHKNKINGAVAWNGATVSATEDWIYNLSKKDLECLDKALENVKSKNLSAPFFTQEDFPIGEMSNTIARISNELEEGYGFTLIRGLDAYKYDEADLKSIYYGMGLYLGRPVQQNPKGDLLGIVTNIGELNNKNTRVYETNAYLPYHTDLSDVVGLLSIRKAKEGGLSSLVSAATVYNTILNEAPEYLEVLYQPFYFSHLGEDTPTASPIFSYHKNKLSCRYLRQYIELGHEIMGIALTQKQVEALDLFDEIMHRDEVKLDMMLMPGDIQLANNYMVMHSRTSFEDFEDISLRRKLIRLWLKMPNARELNPIFPGRNGFSE